MEIHLSKPGGKREGPFTVEQINANLAQRKFRDTDYWAWYKGLDSWVPLHQIPGVKEPPPGSAPDPAPAPEPEPDASRADTEIVASPAKPTVAPAPTAPKTTTAPKPAEISAAPKTAETTAAPKPAETVAAPAKASAPPAKVAPAATPASPATADEPSTEPVVTDSTHATSHLFSGMPVQALEQIFVFTDGEGPAAMQSQVTRVVFQEIIGSDLVSIREQVARDVFGRCNIPDQLAAEGRIPASAWRAMSALKPELTRQAREGAYRVCVRTFHTETDQKLAAFLFYNKQKL